MPHIPGTFKNGDGKNPDIPPVVQWDPADPQVVYNCTNEVFHLPNCDGDCGSYFATEGMTLLLNEQRQWAELNINPDVNVDGLSMIVRLETIEEYLRAQHNITEEEWDEDFKLRKATKMREMREGVEPQIREARTRAMLGVPNKRIIGPNGELLG